MAIGLLSGTIALAQGEKRATGQGQAPPPAGRQTFRKVCKADIKKWCAGVKPGDGHIASCLAEKKTELAGPCLGFLRHAKRVSQFRAACHTAVEHYCHGVKPGAGRVRACLAAHTSELPDACRARLGSSVATAAPAGDVADEAAAEEQEHAEPVADVSVEEEAGPSESTPLSAGTPPQNASQPAN